MTSLREVLESAADDDTARLVYADWLTDQGDPRGEFIHIQCALGRSLRGARGKPVGRSANFDLPVADLEKRERALLKLHQKKWLEPIRPFIRTWSWRGGFVDGVVADATKFMSGAKVIFASTPLAKVQLTAVKPGQLAALSALAPANRLRELDVSSQRLDADGFAELAGFSFLRVLNLHGNHFAELEASQALAACRFDALESLDIGEGGLTDEGLEVLSRTKYFRQLKVLRLGWTRTLTTRAAQIVVAAGAPLEELDFGAVPVGNDGAKALAAAKSLSNLRWLRLDWDVSEPGVMALLDSKFLTKLSTLERVDTTFKELIAERLAPRRQA